MLKPFINLPYPPVDTPVSSGPSTELGKEEMYDYLKDDEDDDKDKVIPIKKDEDKKDDKKKEDDKETEKDDEEDKEEDEGDKEDEEDDELKELEEELEEPPEEKLELMTPVRRREILKKYPNVFKDFPYLENAYYREQQFTELFATPADAKEAKDSQDTLNRFEKELTNGNIENILLATKNESPKSFTKIVDNYLDVLGRIDKDAHQHVIGNIIKTAVVAMVNEGKRKGNDELSEAAEKIYEFVFGTTDFKPPTKLSRDSDEKDDTETNRLKAERQEFVKEKFQTANEDLNTRVNNSIRKTIEANIDPKSSMSEYIRKNAGRDALDTLTDLIEKDTRFKSLTDKLWEKAFQNNFSRESLDAIKSAYFSKARTLLPSVIKKARNEALKGMGKRVKEDESDSTPEKESSNKSERKEQSRSHRPSDKSSVPVGMTTLEFLNKD